MELNLELPCPCFQFSIAAYVPIPINSAPNIQNTKLKANMLYFTHPGRK